MNRCDGYRGDDTTTTTTTAAAATGTPYGTNAVMYWIVVAVMIMSVNNKMNNNKQVECHIIVAFSTTVSRKSYDGMKQ